MFHQEIISRHYPEAQAVEEPILFPPAARIERGRWFVYAGPDLDARVLGRGTTETNAWADASRRLANARRRVRFVLAG